MVFIKVSKSRAYYKRYQTKQRRRREGKTDYRARKRLVAQDKNKYGSAKYRLVVRKTNTRIICQIVCSTLSGDKVLVATDSMELKNYGIVAGYTNYSAAYCTGLLCGRRLLQHLKLNDVFSPAKEVSGEDLDVFGNDRRPFMAMLDIGIVNTTTGHRVFAAMKGACDAGLYVPHSTARFFGASKSEKETSYDPEAHKDHILGKHISDYMALLKKEDPDRYKKQFSKFIANKVEADNLQKMYTDAISKIKADPSRVKNNKTDTKSNIRQGDYIVSNKNKYVRLNKLTKEQRKQRIQEKLAKLSQQAQ